MRLRRFGLILGDCSKLFQAGLTAEAGWGGKLPHSTRIQKAKAERIDTAQPPLLVMPQRPILGILGLRAGGTVLGCEPRRTLHGVVLAESIVSRAFCAWAWAWRGRLGTKNQHAFGGGCWVATGCTFAEDQPGARRRST